MSTPIKFDDIDKALTEADALVQKINTMVTEDITDAHQIEFEKRL